MLDSSQIRRLVRAGLTTKQIVVVSAIADEIIKVAWQDERDLNQARIEVAERDKNRDVTCDNVTQLPKMSQRERDRVRQKNRREKLKNIGNSTNLSQVDRDMGVTTAVTERDIKKPLHIETAHAHERVLLPSLSDPQKEKKEKKSKTLSHAYTPEFEIFFTQAYPNNNGAKAPAFEKYQQAINQGVSHETIIAGARSYAAFAATAGTERRYIKHPASWLHQRGWESDYTIEPRRISSSGYKPDKSDLARAAADEGFDELEKAGFFRSGGE